MLNREQIEAKIAEIERLRAKQTILLDTLRYYCWLEQHGIFSPWEKIEGVSRAIEMSPTVRRDLRHSTIGESYCDSGKGFTYRPDGQSRIVYCFQAISYMINDGSKVLLPYPPFSDAVIYGEKEVSV